MELVRIGIVSSFTRLPLEELEEIISHLGEPHKPVAWLMAYTGLDLSDAVNIRWRSVDLKQNVVRTKRNKTANNLDSRMIDIPLAGKAQGILQGRSKVRQLHDDRVFDVTGPAFQKAWRKALGKAQAAGKFDWHIRVKDLRHFFGSYLLNRGVDPMMIAELMGHTSVNMLLRRYGHYTIKSKEQAMDTQQQETKWVSG